MFLSRRTNGIYYIQYSDSNGRRCKISTETSSKKRAREILRRYKVKEEEEIKDVRLLEYEEEYINYIIPLLRPNSVKSVRLAFKEFLHTQ